MTVEDFKGKTPAQKLQQGLALLIQLKKDLAVYGDVGCVITNVDEDEVLHDSKDGVALKKLDWQLMSTQYLKSGAKRSWEFIT